MKKINEKKMSSVRGVLWGTVSIIMFSLMLSRSDIAIEYMKKGLRLCTASVIPSLFPFMIISELIIKNPIVYNICRILRHPMNWIFGVSEAGGCAFILGALCGFPIGAKTAVSSYDNGYISKNELTRLLCFCNNPGSAFIISAVGESLLGSKKIGIIMYICILLSSITVGILLNLFYPLNKKRGENFCHSYASGGDMMTIFTSSVSSSAITMLTVCAYVVFFSTFVGCISDILLSLSVSELLSTLVFGFFEMTSGVSMASSLQNSAVALILCAAFSAWSGISVHCQIITICSGRGISYKQYFVSKIAQGIICALLMGISVKFIFPGVLSTSKDVFMDIGYNFTTVNSFFTCCTFFIASIGGICRKKSNKRTYFLVIDKKVKKI